MGAVSILILLAASALVWLGYLFARFRPILIAIGFYALMTAAFANYSNWLPEAW